MYDFQNSFQAVFLERLSGRFNSRSELVREVSKVLHLGRDAIYRRLRGDTAVTADELMLLANTFGVSMLLGQADGRSVPQLRYPDGQQPIRDEYDHFIRLQQCLEWIKPLEGASLEIACSELPMHYQLALPTLRSFKVFMYGITSWNLPKWKREKFSSRLIDGGLHGIIEQTVQEQYKLPTRELWSVGVLDVTLRQLRYVAQVGRFSDTADLTKIYDELLLVVDHLEHMASTGKRFPLGQQPTPSSPAFRVYHNELSNTADVILVRSADRSFLFTTLLTPNYVASGHPVLANEVQQWFDNLVDHGNALHFEVGKYAAQYFGFLRRKVVAERERVLLGDPVF